MGDQSQGNRRVEYIIPHDQESSDILEFKKVCAVMLGDLYGLARLGRDDPRGAADFQGKLLTFYQLIRGEMVESDIQDFYYDDEKKDADGKPLKVEYFKYRELASIIDQEFRQGFDNEKAQLILERLNEFIRESGIIRRNIPRALLG